MTDKVKKTVTMSVCVPMSFDIRVEWDGEVADIIEARLSPGAGWDGMNIGESMTEEDLQELDRLAELAEPDKYQ